MDNGMYLPLSLALAHNSWLIFDIATVIVIEHVWVGIV